MLTNAAVLAELAQLKRDGLKIGLSLSGNQQGETLKRALEVQTEEGLLLFDSVQATWNLLEQSAGAALREAHEAGLGVIVKEALANGRLTPRNTNPQIALLHQIAADKATTSDALALAAVLAQPWVDVVLSGAATVEHLESNVTAVTLNFDEETANKLQSLRESPETYWQTRSNLAWN